MPILVKQLQLTELTVMMATLGFKVISLVLTGFSMESWMVYLNLPLEFMIGIGTCCMFTLIIKLSDSTSVPKVLSATTITWIIGEVVGEIMTNTTMSKLNVIFRGSTFLVLAVVMVILFSLLLWLSIDLRAHQHKILLDNVKLTDAEDEELEIEAEQWLLNAYGKESGSSDNEDANQDII